MSSSFLDESADAPSIDLTMTNNSTPLLEPSYIDTPSTKEQKLQALRSQLNKRQENKKKVETAPEKKPHGKDFYLEKVTNFLVTSFLLNLAIEHIFTISLLHDYINSYLDNEAFVFAGSIEGNNWCFIVFYFFRLVGYFLASTFLMEHIQKDEETGKKVIISGIILTVFSMFISTKFLAANYFVPFSIFYAGVPAFVTAPISLFLNLNLSRLGKRNQLNLMLLYTLQHMSFFASIIFLGIICPTILNYQNMRPLQINYHPNNNVGYFIRAFYTSSRYGLDNLPTRMLVVPLFVALFGFGGIISLYGWSCGNKGDNLSQIEWDQLKIKQKMNSLKDLRLDDVIGFLEDSDKEIGSESSGNKPFGRDSFVMTEVTVPKNKATTGQSVVVQHYTPEEDDTRRVIEAHFRGKPMNLNFDRERGEIIIAYKGVNKEPSLFEALFNKHMIYVYLSFCFSSVIPIFFMNKLSRMLLTYLYTDMYVGPALIAVAMVSCFLMLLNILMLHTNRSKKFMITMYMLLNYVLILMFSYLTESLFGMILLASLSIFVFVYMQVLLSFIASYCSSQNRLVAILYPMLYSMLLVGNLFKVFFVDPYSDTFQSMVFVFLIFQGMGFLCITGVNIKKIRQIFLDYGAHQDKLKREAARVK